MVLGIYSNGYFYILHRKRFSSLAFFFFYNFFMHVSKYCYGILTLTPFFLLASLNSCLVAEKIMDCDIERKRNDQVNVNATDNC